MLSNFLIKIIVIFLPSQLGLHFWPAFSRVAGIKIDYLSPTLYFLDLLILFLLILNIKRIFSFVKLHKTGLVIFLLFIFLNIGYSISPENSIFWWLRLDLYLLLFVIIRQRKVKWDDLRNPLLIGTTVVVLIEILQLITQSSLGGPFYFLGERGFSTSTTSIGRLSLFGQEIIRPMSTFSHPNSLAGYLLIVFYLFTIKKTKPWHKLIPFLGILLSFSKTTIIALAFVIFNLKPEIIIIFSITITIIQPFLMNVSSDIQSISDRQFFYVYLKRIFIQNPLTGVGLGNFIPALGKLLPGSYTTPSKLQPIHNLLYLLVSETGLLGLLMIGIGFAKKNIYRIIKNPLVLGLIAIVLFTGTFDHYVWTLPQNKLILLFALSILF